MGENPNEKIFINKIRSLNPFYGQYVNQGKEGIICFKFHSLAMIKIPNCPEWPISLAEFFEMGDLVIHPDGYLYLIIQTDLDKSTILLQKNKKYDCE